MNYLLPERLQALARDYALGTLQGRARRRFERVLREHAAAAQAVAAWQGRFDTLAAAVPRMTPRPALWQELESRLFPPAPAAAAAVQRPWWQRLFGGPTLGGALAGVLLALVVVRDQPAWLGLEPTQETLPQSYVGLLLDAEGKAAVLASSRRHGRTLTVKMLQPLAAPAGTVAQLWALPKDGGKPFAVGVLPAKGSAPIALPESSEKLFFGVSRLAVSFEPAPGAAAPSAPFVLSGHCVKLW
jgi:anti-sigma-K factor RskA